MATPQIENGYTRISNELLEAVLRGKFYQQEVKVILAIIRMTYGWGKKEAQISYGAISKLISCDRNNVMRACRFLEKDNVIRIARGEGRFKTNVVSINKNYTEWVGREAVDNSKKVVSRMTPSVVSRMTPENTKSGVENDTSGGVENDTPLKKPKESIKETVKKVLSAVDKKGNENPKKQSLSQIIKGYEEYISKSNPSGLVEILNKAGFEMTKAWAAIVQARHKSNPAGYLISILADPKHQISDTAFEQAKLEMRKFKYA